MTAWHPCHAVTAGRSVGHPYMSRTKKMFFSESMFYERYRPKTSLSIIFWWYAPISRVLARNSIKNLDYCKRNKVKRSHTRQTFFFCTADRPATPMCHARGVTLENCFSQNRRYMIDIDLKLHPTSSFDDMHPYLEFWRETRSKISKSGKNVFRAWQRDTPITLSRLAGRSATPICHARKKMFFSESFDDMHTYLELWRKIFSKNFDYIVYV